MKKKLVIFFQYLFGVVLPVALLIIGYLFTDTSEIGDTRLEAIYPLRFLFYYVIFMIFGVGGGFLLFLKLKDREP